MSTTITAPVGHRGLTSNEILLALRSAHWNNPIAVANKRDFLNLYTESDFVVATMAGQIYEFEVKVSRSDYAKDRMKLRNRIYSKQHPGLLPNRFWYVTPPGIVVTEELPSFAGLIELREGKLVPVRRAPKLHPECHGIEVLMRLARAMRSRGANA